MKYIKDFNMHSISWGIDDMGYMTRVLKAIATINIIADTENLAADRDTLLSIIDGNSEDILKAIDILEQKKIIKFMRQYGYYDFFDSSIFDLEAMIEKNQPGISDEMVVSILNEKFVDFVLYPYAYNEKYHMNRVFIPIFAKKGDLTKKHFIIHYLSIMMEQLFLRQITKQMKMFMNKQQTYRKELF